MATMVTMATWRRVSHITVAGREADDRHCASLSLLQAKVAEIAENSERQMARVMVNMGSQIVQKDKPSDYQLSAAVSNRTTNYNRLTSVGRASAD
jgi:hypothetical protein